MLGREGQRARRLDALARSTAPDVVGRGALRLQRLRVTVGAVEVFPSGFCSSFCSVRVRSSSP